MTMTFLFPNVMAILHEKGSNKEEEEDWQWI